MHLSDLVQSIQFEIGDAMETDKEEDIDPRLMLHMAGVIVEVDEIIVNRHEIILSPRAS